MLKIKENDFLSFLMIIFPVFVPDEWMTVKEIPAYVKRFNWCFIGRPNIKWCI